VGCYSLVVLVVVDQVIIAAEAFVPSLVASSEKQQSDHSLAFISERAAPQKSDNRNTK